MEDEHVNKQVWSVHNVVHIPDGIDDADRCSSCQEFHRLYDPLTPGQVKCLSCAQLVSRLNMYIKSLQSPSLVTDRAVRFIVGSYGRNGSRACSILDINSVILVLARDEYCTDW